MSYASTEAAQIALRDRATIGNSVVYLGDIAEIFSDDDAELQKLSTTVLMAAPAEGVPEYLHVSRVRSLLASQGIQTNALRFSGVQSILLENKGETPRSAATAELETHDLELLKQAISEAIVNHLICTTGHIDWRVELIWNSAERSKAVKLGHDVLVAGGRPPWTGSQEFEIYDSGATENVTISAKVERLRSVVVSVRSIERGTIIGNADVEVQLAGGHAPATAVESIAEVVGKEAVRAVDAGDVLLASGVRNPLLVQRGETVKVSARTGGITVSTFVVVQQNGALGDLVQVQTLDKSGRFAARVSGWKQLEVLPTGVAAADFANHQ